MTEPNRQSGENEEKIIEIEIERLRPFKEHPFQVKDDKEMFLLQESIEKYGILKPLIARPNPPKPLKQPTTQQPKPTLLMSPSRRMSKDVSMQRRIVRAQRRAEMTRKASVKRTRPSA